jgi:membrane peptidoglycan carboxypeptidase
VLLAYAITKRYSKQDILEMYLNSVYFGEGAFGVENAAETYFGIHAKDLDVAQSALLIGLLPAPSAYSPLSHNVSIAQKQQQEVLSAMKGQRYISADDYEFARNEELSFTPSSRSKSTNVLAPHFAIMIRDALFKEYGEDYVIRAGFHVKTTLNSDWQAYAERVVANQVTFLGSQGVSNGAAVVLYPQTGEILAMVGSHNWDDPHNGKIDMVTTPRQPGSSFKPIVYVTAFDEHILTPATILHDDPTIFPDNYKPKDFDGKYRGAVTVRRALANSLNIPAVETMENVGIADALAMAKNLGISTLGDPSAYGLSLVLGAGEVTLLDLTDAYATFANAGVRNVPVSVLEIRDNAGNSIFTSHKDPQQVVSAGASFLISSILSDAQARAEEFGNTLNIGYPAAVKTGTTEDFRDSLTIGYTPNIAIGVWVGNNDNAPMDQVAGSLGAAPIWKQLMTYILPQLSRVTFIKPDTVVSQVVCPYQFSPAASKSAQTRYTEYFLSGTEPLYPCSSTPTVEHFPTYIVPSLPTTMPTPTDTPFPTPTQIPFPTNPTPEVPNF